MIHVGTVENQVLPTWLFSVVLTGTYIIKAADRIMYLWEQEGWHLPLGHCGDTHEVEYF